MAAKTQVYLHNFFVYNPTYGKREDEVTTTDLQSSHLPAHVNTGATAREPRSFQSNFCDSVMLRRGFRLKEWEK